MRRVVIGIGAVVLMGCGGGWASRPGVVADPHRVARALGDVSAGVEETPLPVLEEPGHPRTCCAFGMDMHVDFASIEVPFFEVGNVISTEQLGAHAYTLPLGMPEVEGNGLVYTCRGGWIDTAHVRENADVQLFLTLRLAAILHDGGTLEIPGHGAPTHIALTALPSIEPGSELAIASTLAAWITYRIGLFHEVSTWYGYEMIGGFSEQPSAFSPEDLYSNALGIRLARAIVEADRFASSREYEEAMVAYLEVALTQLGAQPQPVSRALMSTLDGLWWDSERRLPDTHLVMRRAFPGESPDVHPWRIDDAFERDALPMAFLDTGCAEVEVRPLHIPDHLEGRAISELVELSFSPEDWATALPAPDPHLVTNAELDALIARTRSDMTAVMGAGFDAPRGPLAEVAITAP